MLSSATLLIDSSGEGNVGESSYRGERGGTNVDKVPEPDEPRNKSPSHHAVIRVSPLPSEMAPQRMTCLHITGRPREYWVLACVLCCAEPRPGSRMLGRIEALWRHA